MATDRTTVRIDADLLRRAKIKAAREGTSLTRLVEAGLRREVEGSSDVAVTTVELPVSSARGGWRAPVDPTDNSSVLDWLDGVQPPGGLA